MVNNLTKHSILAFYYVTLGLENIGLVLKISFVSHSAHPTAKQGNSTELKSYKVKMPRDRSNY